MSTQSRRSRGHFLPSGAIPYSLEPDAWDDTCRHRPEATTRAHSSSETTVRHADEAGEQQR